MLTPLPATSATPSPIVQITTSLSSDAIAGSISGDGGMIAFRSSADLVGLNADRSGEIYLVDADGSNLRQVTDSTEPSLAPRLSANGSKVVFISRGDLVKGGNRDRSCELFVANVAGPGLTQLTRASNLDVNEASISGDGSLIAFVGNGNYANANPDKSYELFVVNGDGTGMRQLTSDGNPRFRTISPAMSRDGSRISFGSTADLTGGNADHSLELYSIRPDGSDLVQLTSFAPGNFLDSEADVVFLTFGGIGQSITDDGSKVAFGSAADPFGTNSDGSIEVFLVNTDGTGLAQLTDSPGGGGFGFGSFSPSFRGDGAELVFVSDEDLTGGNPDGGQQIFRISSDGTGLVQLTTFAIDTVFVLALFPGLSQDGSRIGFISDRYDATTNPDFNFEVFVVDATGANFAQLTETDSTFNQPPTISGQGNRVIFNSNADLVGGNPDLSTELFVSNSDGTALRQLTNAAGDINVQSAFGNAIDAAGQTVVFTSNFDLVPGSNADSSFELFSIKPDGTGLRQITSGSGGSYTVAANPVAISRDGGFLVFVSRGDYVGTNADHSFEIYRVTAGGSCVDGGGSTGCTQLTNTAVLPNPNQIRLTISDGGGKVAFAINGDPFGTNPDTNREVYAVNGDGTGLLQLTNTVGPGGFGGQRGPRISADGTTIVFQGNTDPFGTNPHLIQQIFVVRSDGTGFLQLTSGQVFEAPQAPTISADGKLITFASRLDSGGQNADRNFEIFQMSAQGTGLKQLTTGFPGSGNPSMSDDGSRVAFLSTANLNGTHRDLNADIFVLTVKKGGP